MIIKYTCLRKKRRGLGGRIKRAKLGIPLRLRLSYIPNFIYEIRFIEILCLTLQHKDGIMKFTHFLGYYLRFSSTLIRLLSVDHKRKMVAVLTKQPPFT